MAQQLDTSYPTNHARDAAMHATAAISGLAGEPPAVRLAELMRQVAAGDERAFGHVYDATAGRVYSVALRMLGNAATAEEIALDVFVQAWRSADRYDASRASVVTWLLMICRSRALDALRAQVEPAAVDDCDTLPGDDPGSDEPSRLAERSEDQRTLCAALKALAPVERQVIALAFFRGMSHGEMAAHTGIPLGTVKTHVRRALGKMRSLIEARAGGVRS